jgi:hypothetical protein
MRLPQRTSSPLQQKATSRAEERLAAREAHPPPSLQGHDPRHSSARSAPDRPVVSGVLQALASLPPAASSHLPPNNNSPSSRTVPRLPAAQAGRRRLSVVSSCMPAGPVWTPPFSAGRRHSRETACNAHLRQEHEKKESQEFTLGSLFLQGRMRTSTCPSWLSSPAVVSIVGAHGA